MNSIVKSTFRTISNVLAIQPKYYFGAKKDQKKQPAGDKKPPKEKAPPAGDKDKAPKDKKKK